MMLKICGMILVLLGCGTVGFTMSAFHCRTEKELKTLLRTLDYIHSELEYRLTPLPALCRGASSYAGGIIGEVFLSFAEELESQCHANVPICMQQAVSKSCGIEKRIGGLMRELGENLGVFDLTGQIRGIEEAQCHCRKALQEMESTHDDRIRCYKTLGLCAGAALAILLV